MLSSFSGQTAVAQDDAEEAPLQLTEVIPRSNDTRQLILRSVRDSDPQSAEELAKAAAVMMDIDLYNDARIYLGRLDSLTLDDNAMFELHEAIGSDFFAAIQAKSEVQPEGKRVARKIVAATNKVGVSAERIDPLINTLNNNDISVRSMAFRKLRRLGEPAVAAMIKVFAQDDRVDDFPGIRGALKYMGISAQGPLLGAARASDLQVKTEAIRALRHYNSSESLDVMMRAYLSPKSPEFLRRMALESLTQSRYPNDPDVIEARLYERSMDYLMGKREVDGAMMGFVTLWNWDSNAKQLVPTQVSPATAARVLASRRAADLYEIRPELPRNRELYVLTQLEAAKRVVGPRKKVNVDALVQQLNASASEVESILIRALDLGLVPAAVACCEMLESIGDPGLLTAASGKPKPLVQAILFGDRHLQFAALQAIARIDPQVSYSGSSFMLNLAVYLSQSENRPAGLIGHNREDVAQSYAAVLAQSGLYGQAVTSSREFFETATSNPDISVLLVTDTLNRPAYDDLIQQLRHDFRTRRTPIAMLYRDTNRARRMELRMQGDPMFCTIPFSIEPEMVMTHVQRLNDKQAPWEITNLDRRRHAGAAIRWLAKIANDRQTYSFYNLGNQQSALARLLYLPGFSEPASQILANLGTPLAQRELVNFASQTGLPMDERAQAVDAFARSIQAGSTLLTTKEIEQQYDRYNASSTESADTQKVLGAILDAIESRRNTNAAKD